MLILRKSILWPSENRCRFGHPDMLYLSICLLGMILDGAGTNEEYSRGEDDIP